MHIIRQQIQLPSIDVDLVLLQDGGVIAESGNSYDQEGKTEGLRRNSTQGHRRSENGLGNEGPKSAGQKLTRGYVDEIISQGVR